jgi:hypothetical protein
VEAKRIIPKSQNCEITLGLFVSQNQYFSFRFIQLSKTNDKQQLIMPKQQVAKKSSPAAKHKISSTAANRGGGGGAHQKILNTAAAMKTRFGKERIERTKITPLTGIHGKSTIANALTKLKNLQWMDVTKEDITITDLGLENSDASAVDDFNVPTTNKEYIDSIVEQYKLKPAKAVANAIDELMDGCTYSKKELAKKMGAEMNSTFANLMTNLKKAGITEYVGKADVRLHDSMFQFSPRSCE